MAHNKKVYTNIKIDQSPLVNKAYLEVSNDGGETYSVVDEITIPANTNPVVADFDNMPVVDVDNPLIKVRVRVVPQTTTTTTSTTTQAPSPFKYATEQDALNIHNANVGDMLLTGPNLTSGGERTIDIRPSFNNTFTLDACKKILIKGGNYDRIRLELPGLSGTEECPIIITNYDGQVKCKSFNIVGISHFKLTGKYDYANQTGDVLYRGHVDGYAFSSGKYGIFVDNQWTNNGAFLLSVQGIEGSQSTNWEIEFIESGNGGFSNVFKSDNIVATMDNVKIHDLYIHDTHGEGVYLGSTAGGNNQHIFTNLHFYNNRILRAGNEALQLGQLSSNCLIENNVIHGAVNWKSPFGAFQDNTSQLGLKNGGITFRNNICMAGAGKWGNWFTSGIQDTVNFSNVDISNNVFLYCRGGFGIYFGQSQYLNVPLIRYNNNWHGKFDFQYNEVYTGPGDVNATHIVRIANDNTMEMRGNKWDGTGNKSTFYSVVGGSLPSITTDGNEITSVPDVAFVNYMFPTGFDYLLYEEWASRVGDTWGDENQFPYTNTRKGEPVVYNQNDIVSRFSKFYRSLQNNNSLVEPGVTTGWQSWWEPILWTKPNSSTSTIPPDDVRLVSTSFYNGLEMGLKDNDPYNGPSTTTSSTTTTTSSSTSTTSTTTTTTTLGVAPDFKFTAFTKDNGNNTFTLKWGTNRATLTSEPKLVALGSSTLVGVGATSGNGLGAKLQQYLNQYGGKLFNLSKASTDTNNWMPTGNNSNVDEHRNVTAGLMANPNFALIVTASNDVLVRTPEQALANLVEMYNSFAKRGIVCFIEACQPRTDFTTEQQNQLLHLRDLIIATFPEEIVIDVIPTLRDTASVKPCDINPIYNSDGTHLNDAGVVALTNLITAKFDSFFQNAAYVQYEVERSNNPESGFILFDDSVITPGQISKVYNRQDAGKYYYRVRGKNANDTYGEYTYVSNGFEQVNNIGDLDQTIQIDFSIETNGPPPSDWNNFNAPSTGADVDYILENLVDTELNTTNTVVQVTRKFTGANAGGANAGVYPLKVMQDSWNISNTNKPSAEIRIGGLSTSHVYTIDILSSRASAELRYLGFKCGDNYNWADANSSPNIANQYNISTIEPLIPDTDGNLFISFCAISGVGYLNSIVLKRHTVIPPGQTTTTSTSTTTTSSTTSSTTTTTTTYAPVNGTINVNVYSTTNSGTPYDNAEWNNWNVGSISELNGFTDLKLANGTSTGFNLSVLGFDGYVDNGSSYGGGIVAAEVLRYGIYTTAGPNFTGNYININITGLNNAVPYTFEFVGSRASTGNATTYQAVGTNTVTSSSLVTDSNKSNSVFINDVMPSGGTITLKVRKTTGATFAYLNAFRIYPGVAGSTTTTTTTSGTTTTTTTTNTGVEADSWTVQSGSANAWFNPVPGQQAYVYTPTGYNNGNQNNYPAMIFLHGAGQRGSNISGILATGLPAFINEGQDMDCLVMCPQLPDTFNGWNASYVKQAYDWFVANYRIDASRFYITGLSLGATGSSDFVGAYPDLVAAYVVAAGTYDRSTTPLNNKKDKPGWYHHGDRDTTQNTGNSSQLIDAINALSPKPKYPPLISLYGGLAHSDAVWNDKLYNKSIAKYDFEQWLLLHSTDEDVTAANYVTKAEQTLEIHDYNNAKRLVNLLPEDSNKIELEVRLSDLKTDIDGYNRRFIIDLGATTSIGNINSLTSGATGSSISNLVDENGIGSSYGFTVVQKGTASGATETTSNGLSNDYFGYPYSFSTDVFNAYGAGGIYKFTGLDNGKNYRLRVYPLKDKISFNEPNTPAIVVGSTVKYVYANYNTTEWIEFNALSPVSGEIAFNFKGAPVLNSGVTPSIDPSGANVVNTVQVSLYQNWTVYIAGVVLVEENDSQVTTTTSTSSSTTTTTTTFAPTTTTTTTTGVSGISKFNFNKTARSLAGWTDVSGSPHLGVISATDISSGVTVSSIASKWGVLGGNTSDQNLGGTGSSSDFPANVMLDYWFNYSLLYGSNGANLKLSNLTPNVYYRLKMMGSRSSTAGTPIPEGELRRMNFYASHVATVGDASEKSILGFSAVDSITTQTLTLSSNASGELYLGIYAGGGAGNTIGYINGLIVERIDGNTTTTSTTSTTSSTTSSTTTTTTTNAPGEEIARFNFGPSSGVAVSGWNSVFADPLGGNRSATDSATGIGVLSLGTYNGSTNTAWGQLGGNCAVIGGQTTGGNTGVVPDNVLLSYWYNTKNTQTTPARINGVEINGLEVGGTYTLQFVASRTTGSPSRKCTYDITDANETITTSPFDAKNNTSALVTVTGRVADISGKIFFGCHGDLSSADQTNDIYGFLNGLIITRTA